MPGGAGLGSTRGMRVTAFHNGDDALWVMSDWSALRDVVVSHIAMPGFTGDRRRRSDPRHHR